MVYFLATRVHLPRRRIGPLVVFGLLDCWLVFTDCECVIEVSGRLLLDYEGNMKCSLSRKKAWGWRRWNRTYVRELIWDGLRCLLSCINFAREICYSTQRERDVPSLHHQAGLWFGIWASWIREEYRTPGLRFDIWLIEFLPIEIIAVGNVSKGDTTGYWSFSHVLGEMRYHVLA